jgi:cytochrome c oxidase subunit 2
MNFSLLPESASTFVSKVDPIFWFLTCFVFGFAVFITCVMVYLGVRYRKKEGENRRSEHVENLPLEITWTLIPFVIAMGLFVWGAVVYANYQKTPADTLEISVIGKRWMWKVQHPNGVREVNTLHVPVGHPVQLTMTSQDVIHSFFIPAFRVKQDVLPGRYTKLWFEATKPGTYHLFCAEYCGTEHSTMVGQVIAMEPHEYLQWLQGGPAQSPAQAGETLFTQMGCVTCHAAGAESRGPNLHGVYGKEVKLADGTTVIANEEYIRESIVNPSAKVVAGFAPVMPSFKNNLSDEDVLNLVAYIKSLAAQQ